MSISKKKEEEKEKKFLGRLSYKLDYDFDKNARTDLIESPPVLIPIQPLIGWLSIRLAAAPLVNFTNASDGEFTCTLRSQTMIVLDRTNG
uniref:Uncharacterized protein n=1 Tax=Heterorhabditis bacteriophora TaxID=37862 RepID=A0A1I7WAT4_HETBA